jgi:hypothetical protein
MYPKRATLTRRLSRPTPVALALLSLTLLWQTGGHAAPGDALPFARSYIGTINYVVAGVDVTEQSNPIDQNGFSAGTISIGGVPADADIVAAYLYWETITLAADPSQAAGVTFRGNELLLNDVMGVKKSSQELIGTTASCWSSGQPLMMTKFRADVLRFLPIRLDQDNQPTGKRIVNAADLTAHGLAQHTVTLPVRTGNQLPESAGASLLVVYRDETQPLRKVVVYDGIHIQPSLTTPMTQSLQGFYKSAAVKSAKITHIVAGGQPNSNERVFFNDGVNTSIAPPDPLAGGSASQRGWANLTYDVSALMNPGNNSAGGFGETATTTVDHSPGGGYDCLSWGAVVFSTAVADVDADGLPDGLEDAPLGLKDPATAEFPAGQPLPNLNAMGASAGHKDLFVEVNALKAMEGTSYGSPSAPYNSTITTLTDPAGHTHMPTPEVLKLVGDAFAAQGITPHFDVGDIASYHALGVFPHVDWVDDYSSTEADLYLVPSAHARGGEVAKEVACDESVATCQFPAFPGTVSWKTGLQLYRDAPVGDNGEELNSDLTDPNNPGFDWNTGTHRRRFDRDRFGLFHYVLNAHARGKPRSPLPCLVNGVPAPYDLNNGTACTTNNPDFHAPLSTSGVADLPGGNALVTLGLWDDFVGRPFVRASTTFHEIGHNLNLWHGGVPVVWGNKALNTSTIIEPNCKPNYLSSMSYLFQVHGLFDDADNIHLNYSSAAHGNLNESASLVDGVFSPFPAYRAAWFAPATSALASSLGVSAATRYCHGVKFDPNLPAPSMARVFTLSVADPVDWNGDLVANTSDPQDVNLDGTLSSVLNGYNDWGAVRLDQIAAGRRTVKFQDGDFMDFGSGDFVDFGSGDFVDFGSGDFVDFGSGDFVDFGSGVYLDQESGDFVDFGSGDFVDFGSGDFVDFGSGDFMDFGSATERQELDYDAARGARSAPYRLRACVIGTPGCTSAQPSTPTFHRVELRWQPPTVGSVFTYHIERKRGAPGSNFPWVPIATSATATYIDMEQLPNGIQFSYRVIAEFDDVTPHTFSAPSQPATITAINEAPMAVADAYQVNKNATLNVAAPGVLGNDTDVDSPASFLRAVLVQAPATGTFTFNANGSFSFKPKSGSTTPVTFSYKVNNGFWSGDPTVPLSADSNTVTVTITILP